MEIHPSQEKRKQRSKNEDFETSETTSSILKFTFWGCQKGKRREMSENIFEDIIAENFPNLGKETDIQFQENIEYQKISPQKIHIKAHCN